MALLHPHDRLAPDQPQRHGHPATDVYGGLGSASPRQKPPRRPGGRTTGLRLAAIAGSSILIGIVLNAAFLHFGGRTHRASVVIGENVIRKPTGSIPHTPTPAHASSLVWGSPVLVDPSARLTAISCASGRFCTAVDAEGDAVQFVGSGWTAPNRIDGAPLTSVSCPSTNLCVAVDQGGNALTYDGRSWSPPQRIDKTTFPELTSVSCASTTFCATVDGDGNGLVYDGKRWSPPEQVDPQGWSLVSRDMPAVSCPSDGFCVGVDHESNVFFYVAGSWQAASNVTGSGATADLKFDNAISCSSASFCVASRNLGNLLTYDGTQWSLPIAADPTNYIVSVQCTSPDFCAAVDSLLPPGFNSDSGNGNGQVITYNGITWSAPQRVDDVGITTALACPSTQFCMVVDETGHAVMATAPTSGLGRS